MLQNNKAITAEQNTKKNKEVDVCITSTFGNVTDTWTLAHSNYTYTCSTLYVTHIIICQDFGSIFSTLLPGTSAKLSPPEGMDVLDGLEVKVAFGGIWKDSLQELSGGQK